MNQKRKQADAFFDQWVKDREAKGISLKKRIIGREKEGPKVVKKTTKKVTIKDGQGDEESEEGTTAARRGGTQKSSTMKSSASAASGGGGSSSLRVPGEESKGR